MTKVIAGNLHTALKAVLPYASKDARLPVLKNVLLFSDGGCLYAATTDLESVAIARCGAKFETEFPPVTVPAKLLAEVLASYDREAVVEIEVTERTQTMRLTHVATKGSIKMRTTIKGMDAAEFPKVNLPAAWPDGQSVVVLREFEAEVSKKDWLYWKYDAALAGFVPARGKRITFPGVAGVFFGTGRGCFALTDSATGLRANEDATLAEHAKFLAGKDLESRRAQLPQVPAHLPSGELPKWGAAFLRVLGNALHAEEDSNELGAFGEQLGPEALAYLNALVANRVENRAAWEAKCQAERAEAELKAKMEKEFLSLRKEVFAYCFAQQVAEKAGVEDSATVAYVAARFCGNFCAVSKPSGGIETWLALEMAMQDAFDLDSDSVLAVVNAHTEPTETVVLPDCDPAPDSPAPIRNLYPGLPADLLAVMPQLESVAEVVLGVGNVVWCKAVDKVAEESLAKAGFKYAPSLGAWHAKTERAKALPIRATPQAPRSVRWQPYDRTPIQFPA